MFLFRGVSGAMNQRLQEQKEKEKRRIAREVKASKAAHKKEVERQRRADIAKARKAKAAIKVERAAAKKRREAKEVRAIMTCRCYCMFAAAAARWHRRFCARSSNVFFSCLQAAAAVGPAPAATAEPASLPPSVVSPVPTPSVLPLLQLDSISPAALSRAPAPPVP